MRLVHCSCLTPIQDNVPARRPFWTQRPACGVPSPLKVTIPSVDRGNVYTWLTYSAIRGMGGRHSVLPEAINRPVPLRSTHAWDGRRAGSNVREYQFMRSRPRSTLRWTRRRIPSWSLLVRPERSKVLLPGTPAERPPTTAETAAGGLATNASSRPALMTAKIHTINLRGVSPGVQPGKRPECPIRSPSSPSTSKR